MEILNPMNENQIRVESIEVDKLFGYYTYKLKMPKDGNFMILYGDNGCGKTTILSTIYHLLNPERTNGHRFAVSQIPFKKFIINLSNGDSIEAVRNDAHEKDYVVKGIQNNKELFEYNLGDARKERVGYRRQYEKYCSYLEKLKLNTLFMSANRQIIVSEEDDDVDPIFDPRFDRFEYRRMKSRSKERDLSEVMDRFHRWMQTNVMKNTNDGNRDIDSLYENIIKEYNKQERSPKDIKESFSELTKKNEKFKRLGLSTDILKSSFIKKITKMSDAELNELAPILESYVSSLNIRLNALQPIEKKLSILESYLSKFFSKKTIQINALDGLRILSEEGTSLHYSKLSSGEKQILYLFCSAVISVTESSIVIIDEPEISLNIKWQRAFLQVLNEMIGENNVQVIIASHSIDLITPYSDAVVEMENV